MALAKRAAPYAADIDDFVDVTPDMRWRCVRCGFCCGNVFSRTWLDITLTNYIGDSVGGYCKWFDREKSLCSIHGKRPNICRAYPFIIRKEDDHYKLQVHRLCSGLGQGDPVSMEEVAAKIVRYCEEDLDLDFIMRWDGGKLRLYRIK